MNRLCILICHALLLNFIDCDGQNSIEPSKADPYESCCGAEPVEFTEGKAYLFVPNVFTPNGDKKNDYFSPKHDKGIVGFDTYLIFTPVGDTLLFASAGYDPDNIENTAWNGMLKNGEPYIGLFKYQFTVFLKDGGLYKIEGKACRVECGPNAKKLKDKKGCFYPVQTDNNGRLKKDAPNQESDCFD